MNLVEVIVHIVVKSFKIYLIESSFSKEVNELCTALCTNISKTKHFIYKLLLYIQLILSISVLRTIYK